MSKQRLGRWIGGVALACVMVWFVPLVRVTPLDGKSDATTAGAFDAGQLAERLWAEKLTPSFEQAHDAIAVLDAIESDPTAARENFGRTMGVSRGFMILVRGTGTIISVERSKVGVAIGDASEADILLETGPIFGNAVRDSAALIDSNEVANSQEFNAVSAELNRLVEERVVPSLKANATAGRPIQFVGCAEVKDPARFKRPLKVIPVSIEFE